MINLCGQEENGVQLQTSITDLGPLIYFTITCITYYPLWLNPSELQFSGKPTL